MSGTKADQTRDKGSRDVFRVVVLASGNGSNLQAIIDQLHGRSASVAGAEGPIIEVVLVVSDQPGARALERAKKAGIPTAVCPLAPGADRKEQEKAVLEAVSGPAQIWWSWPATCSSCRPNL